MMKYPMKTPGDWREPDGSALAAPTDSALLWEAYGPVKGEGTTFVHESAVGPTEGHDIGGPLCVVSGDTGEESLANARRIADLLNKHGLQEPNSGNITN